MNEWIRQELSYFFSGLSFYTLIPCPAWVTFSSQNLNKSRKYLPLIGLLIGAVAACVLIIAGQIFPVSVSIALSMIATVYLTGAFHEDGLADCADGFGGGWEKSQILRIMKDSRIGAYGTISLILIFGFKFILLWEIAAVSYQWLPIALILGHSVSRLMPSLVMQFYDYVSETNTSKSQSVTSVRLNALEMLWSVLPLLILLTLVADTRIIIALLPIVILTAGLARYFQKRIGGYTGDCLGATQQLSEVCFYASVLALP